MKCSGIATASVWLNSSICFSEWKHFSVNWLFWMNLWNRKVTKFHFEENAIYIFQKTGYWALFSLQTLFMTLKCHSTVPCFLLGHVQVLCIYMDNYHSPSRNLWVLKCSLNSSWRKHGPSWERDLLSIKLEDLPCKSEHLYTPLLACPGEEWSSKGMLSALP